MKRIVLAAILGGLTLFVWMYVAHDVLGIGEMAVGEIPNEAVVLSAMRGAIPEAGFYIFPGFGLGPKPTSAQRNAAMPEYMKKYEQSPHGILIYHPPSGPFHFGTRSEEHTSELQSHSDLHSFPTRRSSDLFQTKQLC